MLVYKSYWGSCPNTVCLSMGFFASVDGQSKSARSIHSLTASIGVNNVAALGKVVQISLPTALRQSTLPKEHHRNQTSTYHLKSQNIESALHENNDICYRKLSVEELEQKQTYISIFTEIFTSHYEKSINKHIFANGQKNKLL